MKILKQMNKKIYITNNNLMNLSLLIKIKKRKLIIKMNKNTISNKIYKFKMNKLKILTMIYYRNSHKVMSKSL